VSRALDWDALCAYCYLPRRHRTRTERHELDCENIAVQGLELVQPIGSEGLPFRRRRRLIGAMSALGHKRTFHTLIGMSAFRPGTGPRDAIG
jgi:hypothetical protein